MHVSQSMHLRQCSRQRRDFLTACGSVATGLATWQLAGESAPAIEPIARNGRANSNSAWLPTVTAACCRVNRPN